MFPVRQVALDLFLMRKAAVALSGLPEVSADWPSVIDNWAGRFFHEMDYEREARVRVQGAVCVIQRAGCDVTGIMS